MICALAGRLGAEHPGFEMSARELIDWTLQHSGWGTLAELEQKRWIDCQPDFDTAHYVNGFNWPDGKFRFKPDWPNVPFRTPWQAGPVAEMPEVARPLGGDRGRRRRTSVPARDLAGAQLPQLDASTRRRHRRARERAGPR